MHTPEAALAEILERVRALAREARVPLAEAPGRVLARDVASDVDLPPFEKSAMDGFAVRSSDFAKPSTSSLPPTSSLATTSSAPTTGSVIGESRAGAPFLGEVRAGQCVEIFTGAEVPAGCDAVV